MGWKEDVLSGVSEVHVEPRFVGRQQDKEVQALTGETVKLVNKVGAPFHSIETQATLKFHRPNFNSLKCLSFIQNIVEDYFKCYSRIRTDPSINQKKCIYFLKKKSIF